MIIFSFRRINYIILIKQANNPVDLNLEKLERIESMLKRHHLTIKNIPRVGAHSHFL